MRKKVFMLFTIAAMIVSLLSMPVFADATKVVTIGQDLSDEQETFILNYFGVDLATTHVIYVNNQQEREYVGSWIPLEQIGNITISSAYVQPTTSGGIQVKTANLTYVTGNMIASVLSTAGVKNCNIVAAAPFPVSGTGALTGVMIAYQVATGEPLNEIKRDLAVKEFTVTQQASAAIGEEEALQLVNAVKMEVIQSEVPADNTVQIEQIVDEVINYVEQTMVIDNSTTNIDQSTTQNYQGLTEEDRKVIIDLATEIARQEYQYEDVKETLERVEENLSRETNISIALDNSNQVDASSANTIDASSENVNTNTNSNQNDVNNNNADTNQNNVNNNNADTSQNNVNSQNDINNDNSSEAVNDSDSILSNTNDDLIDAVFQSSTLDEDITTVQPAETTASEAAEAADDLSSLYDMSSVEFYVENPAQEIVTEEPATQLPVLADPEPEAVPAQTPAPEEPATEIVINWDRYIPEDAVTEEIYTEALAEATLPEEIPTEALIPGLSEEIPTEALIPELSEEIPTEALIPGLSEETATEEDINWDLYIPEDTVKEVVFTDPGLPGEETSEEETSEEETSEEMTEEYNMAGGETIPGGWTIYTDGSCELPDMVQEAMEKAMEGYVGMDFTPVTYLGSQVVAGMNYRILCTGTPVVLNPEPKLVVVTIYADFDGNSAITDVADFTLADLEDQDDTAVSNEILVGGWITPDDVDAADLPEDVSWTWAAVMADQKDTAYTPAALLGTKVIAGEEFAVLAYVAPAEEDTAYIPAYYAVVFMAANADGTDTLLKIVPLNLADLSSDYQ